MLGIHRSEDDCQEEEDCRNEQPDPDIGEESAAGPNGTREPLRLR
jgi:hypothetical protein